MIKSSSHSLISIRIESEMDRGQFFQSGLASSFKVLGSQVQGLRLMCRPEIIQLILSTFTSLQAVYIVLYEFTFEELLQCLRSIPSMNPLKILKFHANDLDLSSLTDVLRLETFSRLTQLTFLTLQYRENKPIVELIEGEDGQQLRDLLEERKIKWEVECWD